jgi:hypothetical protein
MGQLHSTVSALEPVKLPQTTQLHLLPGVELVAAAVHFTGATTEVLHLLLSTFQTPLIPI